jgi:sugar lactone lactonase YvrE
VRSDKKQDVTLNFGYSDEVTVFLNGRRVFNGDSAYRSRDRSFLGVVGLFDTVYLPLEKGLNEILLIVKESFGGWGFMARADRELDRPVKRHDRLVKLWETEDVFKIPESVIYDPKEEILYVTSFNKLRRGSENAGFISRLTLDGEVETLEWITGLDGPCGMDVRGKKLFVVESSGNLVEIDKKKGEINKRYPIPEKTFLNDVILDKSENIYVTDTTNDREGNDIYRLKNGRIEVWKSGDEIFRSNGIYLHEKNLLVGNSGDGMLKTVGLEDGRVEVVTCLGAGIIDGIRVDGDGNYLVSQWEGRIYSVTPSGEVTELIDNMEARLNTADFEFIKKDGVLVVPTFLGNKVVAYRLTGKEG